MSASLYIAIILVIAIIAYMIVQQILNKRAVKELDQNEFHNGIRKLKSSMLEKVDYDYGHINGSRNIPMTMFRQRFQGLRKTNRYTYVMPMGLLAIEPSYFEKEWIYRYLYVKRRL